MSIKPFDELDITDPIMFGLVFSNTHIAKPFIEHLLGIEIDHLETPTPEAVLSYDAEHKGVRYDVFARETNENGETIRSFDLEMQMVDTKELPQRARYYQSVCDGVALSKGDFYTSLREQYVIFLCPMDIFGHGFPVYHFENRARENPEITLGDLSYKNFYIYKVRGVQGPGCEGLHEILCDQGCGFQRNRIHQQPGIFLQDRYFHKEQVYDLRI